MIINWKLLVTIFAASIILGTTFSLFLVDQRVIDLWTFRNELFPGNRGGAFSAFISIGSLVLYAACIVFFYRRSSWAPFIFLAVLAMGAISTFSFGPDVSSIWSSILSMIMIYTGAYMSAILLGEKRLTTD